MNNIGTIPNNFANFVTPLNPVTRQPVGQENPDAKGSVLPPVVEAEESAALQNREESSETKDASSKEKEQKESPQQNDEQKEHRAEQEEIKELAARDREVRAHEQAHVNVGGVYAGAPSYSYERGSNGVNYAVAGEVPISAPGNTSDPEQALKAAEQIRRAALAPAEPSYQDLRVAAQATQMAIQARAELSAQEARARTEDIEQANEQRAEQQETNDARTQRVDELFEQINDVATEQPEPGSLVDDSV